MRKIDKSIILSKVYKAWEEALEHKQEVHPKYNSSKFSFYKDIVMNLYYCQNGLCAYTEKAILLSGLEAENWSEEGRYINSIPFHFGELEHFDESLKENKAWLWDNLLMVESKINRKKSTKTVDTILKPDNPEYDPFALLAYNHETHIFYPNPNLDEHSIERIAEMIDTLGLNYVKDWRKQYISERIKAIDFGLEPEPVKEYVTAYEMTLRNLSFE